MNERPDQETIETEISHTPSDGTQRLQLRVVGGTLPRTIVLPLQPTLVVGRSAEADVRIDDGSISRRHCLLHVHRGVQVEDLGSANGTRVRGVRLEPNVRVDLRPGDMIEFGKVLCVLAGAAPPEPAVAPQPDAKGGARGDASADIVIEDPAMVQLHRLLDKVADGNINVLLLGETGVGKEVFAERVHRRSSRRDGPYLKLNCAAFTETLIEAELFGHEKGSFTGAVAAKAGLFESAEGGTVFLDEVGELPLSVQVKLLRVLEERQVRRVGAVRAKPFDVRIVSATNRDLEAEIAAGRFRSDLYFRLNGFSLVIPPLRDRKREIASLARKFVTTASQQARKAPPTISAEAMRLLETYRWPGNIRELRNVMERAVLLTSDRVIAPEHLPVDRMAGGSSPDVAPVPAQAPAQQPTPPSGAYPAAAQPAPREDLPDSLRDALDVVERQRIIDALDRCAGNQTRAAALLGISRRALVNKLEQHNLPRPRKDRGEK